MIKNILYIDDEKHNLQVFDLSFSDDYNIFTATNREQALKIFEQNSIQVMITDQKMPDIEGTDLINEIKEKHPGVISILLTAYAEVDLLITAINSSTVFRFLQKPWKYDELKHTIDTALATYYLKKEKERLFAELTLAKVRAEESDRLKSSFLANISHEIRTPLNGIIGFSSMLMNGGKNKEKLIEYEKILTDSCDRLIEVIEDLVMASQLQAGSIRVNKREFAVCSLMESIKNKYQSKTFKKGISFEVSNLCYDEKVIINSDKSKIFEVFNQLIINAIKFTSEGGVEFGMKEVNGKGVFFVKDTGIGMDKDRAEHIFGFFNQGEEVIYTRDFDGNGLGLSIAKGLVNLMGGDLWFETEKGKGTTFYFSVPYERVVEVKLKEVS